MKKLSDLYKNTYELNNIIEMTDKVLKTVRNKKLVNEFETYKIEHIINIKNRLKNEGKLISKYNIFLIKDPKYRR